MNGKDKNAYKILAHKPEGKNPLRKRSKQDDNIQMDIKETRCNNMEWIYLAQNRNQWWDLVNTVMKVRVL